MLKLPTPQRKKSLTVQIDADLLDRIRSESRLRNVTLREIVEYGLRTYLQACERVGAPDTKMKKAGG